MNSKRSYLDSLNAGRQHKPATALEQISRTLEELERRLDRTVENRKRPALPEHSTKSEPGLRSVPPARESLHSSARRNGTARWQEDQYASVSRITDELRVLREELRETVAAELHEEFEILRGEIRRTDTAMASASDSSALGMKFERLADMVGALAERSDERGIQTLRLELEKIRSEMSALAREETLRSVGAQWDPAIDALSLRVEEIGEAIRKLPESLALDSLEEKMRALAIALDHLLGHADSHSSDLYRLIEERLDEISRAIAASFSVERSYSMDPEPFERIEARISSLARQIEELVEDQSSAGIADRLNHLSDRIDHIGQRIELPEKAVEQLARQMMVIADRLDAVSRAPDVESLLRQFEDSFSALAALVEQQGGDLLNQEKVLFRELETRVDALAEKIGHSDSADESHSDLLAAIDARFAELTAKLDARTQYADEPFRTLEGRLEDISRRLQGSSPPDAGVDSELIRRLEAQVAELSAHLAEPTLRLPELDDLGPRLDEIERSIAGNRDAIFDAARRAAQETIETLKGTFLGSTAELAAEVKVLEKLTRRADDRNTRTFEAIHDTLLKIVDRLSLLENTIGRDQGYRPAAKFSIEPTPSIEPKNEETVLRDYDAAEFDPLDAPGEDRFKPMSKQESDPIARVVERPEPAAEVETDAILSKPLEPASGALDLNAIIRRVRDENGPHMHRAPPDISKSDFIAAARRAAQAAAAEADAVKKKQQADARGTPNRFGLGRILRPRKGMALMTVAGTAIITGGLQLSGVLATSEGQTAQAVQETENASPAESDEAAAPSTGAESERLAAEAPAADAEAEVIPGIDREAALVVPAPIELPAEAGPAALREAAEAGDPKALFEIGSRYADGRGFDTDMAKAAAWYERAAEAGLAPAQYRIGNFYEKGTGVERDFEKAKAWYQLAAGQGNANAMHNLGVLFAMGANGMADHESAVRWFQRAAELGVQDSQFNLGILHAKGIGVTKDLEESYKWFALVAAGGDKDAAAKRDEIAELLPPKQLERAKAKAKLWKTKPVDQEANTVNIPASWDDSAANTTGIDPRQAVASIQHILNENGYGAGPADGLIGEQTKSAIMAFQKDHGLDTTGDVSEKFVQALFEKK